MKEKWNKFWKSTWLKLRLFNVWFLKNFKVFLKILLLVFCVMTITGHVNENTFILGKTIYPIFKGLFDGINSSIPEGGVHTALDIFMAVVSIGVAFIIFRRNLKRLAAGDIKSRSLKIAIVKAGLYFDKSGRLVKKAEVVLNQDLDKNGKIADKEEKKEGFFSSLKRSARELKSIANVSGDETIEEALEETGMEDGKALLIDDPVYQIDPVEEEKPLVMDNTTEVLNVSGDTQETTDIIEEQVEEPKKLLVEEDRTVMVSDDIEENEEEQKTGLYTMVSDDIKEETKKESVIVTAVSSAVTKTIEFFKKLFKKIFKKRVKKVTADLIPEEASEEEKEDEVITPESVSEEIKTELENRVEEVADAVADEVENTITEAVATEETKIEEEKKEEPKEESFLDSLKKRLK